MKLVLAALLFASPLPDVLAPGTRAIDHELVLEWDEDRFPQQFFAHSSLGPGTQSIEPGEPFSFSGKYGTRIYAVPEGQQLLLEDSRNPDPRWASAAPPVAEVGAVPVASTLQRIETRIAVAGIEESELQLEILGEDRERNFALYLVPIALGLAVLGGLSFVRRRRSVPA